MPSPRHHVVDVEHAERAGKSAGKAGTLPTADSTLAEDLRDKPTSARCEEDTHGQELVIEGNAEASQDGGPPRSAPIFFIGSPDDNTKGNPDIRKPATSSTLAEDLRDRFTIAETEQERHVEESVIESDVEPTLDGGRPRSDPIFFIASPHVNPKRDAGIRNDSIIEEGDRLHQEGSSGDFFQNCSQCKNKLPETASLYMHGGDDVYAFCSVGCRRKWTELDGDHMEVATTSDGGVHKEDIQTRRS